MFANEQVDLARLRERAFNLRWAAVPDDVVPLTAADSDFPAAQEIRLAVSRYASEGYFCYGPPHGLLGFRRAVANRFADRFGVSCQPDTILPTNSAASAMFIAIRHLIAAGDEVIVLDPVDFLFESAIRAANGQVKRLRLPFPNSMLNRDRLEELITPRTKLICLCNPCNPTGKVFDKAELMTISEIVLKYGLWLLSDEVWSDIVFPPFQHISIASIDHDIGQRTVTVYGFSKGYSIAGLRIGALMCTNVELYRGLLSASKVETTAEGATPIAQVAAQTALEKCGGWLKLWNSHLLRQRELAMARLSAIHGVRCHRPQGTFVLFPKIEALNGDAQRISDYLLKVGRVGVVPGSSRWFGPMAEGHIRISFATSQAILEEGLSRIEKALGTIESPPE